MSGIATGTALAIGLGAAGSVASGAIGASAAGNAADTQANAATQAAQIQAQQSDKALQFNQQQWNQTQANQAPFLAAGQGAAVNLANLLGVLPQNAQQTTTQYGGQAPNPNDPAYALQAASGLPYSKPGVGVSGTTTTPLSSMVNPALGASGSLLTPWTQQFQAPSAMDAQNTPGYQFTLNQGLQALDRGAAARGSVLTGGTGQAEQQFGQNLASTTYQQTYNNALTQYQQAYNQFQTGQANTYNRLAGLAGAGQTSAGQLSSAGQNASNNASSLMINSGNAQAQGLNNAAAANASGYVGGANAWGGALNNLGAYAQLGQLLQNTKGNSGAIPGIGTDYNGWAGG